VLAQPKPGLQQRYESGESVGEDEDLD